MFDITSSKLFLLAIVALLVIGPKDFPILLRTIGKYVGIIRGHAKEFRAQFDEAMRESELSQLKKDVENIAQEAEASLNATGKSVEKTFEDARQSVEGSLDATPAPVLNPLTDSADGLPITPPQEPAHVAPNGADGTSPAGPDAPAAVPVQTAPEPPPTPAATPTQPAPAPTPEKAGV